jgi:hypothetical protein
MASQLTTESDCYDIHHAMRVFETLRIPEKAKRGPDEGSCDLR